MSGLRPYSNYKESSIHWLPGIPSDWTVEKVKRLVTMTVGWTPPTADNSSFAGSNLWANISDLGPRVLGETAKRISDEAVIRSRISRSPKGSLMYSFKLSVGQVSFAGVDMYTNEAIATFSGSQFLSLAYAYYALPTYFIENATENIYGAKILNQERLLATRIALPQPAAQRQIAGFLDRETAEIDAFISDQEKLIALLAERRAATIDGLVRGSAARQEGSKVKLAWAFTFLNGDRGPDYPDRDDFQESGVPFVNAGHLKDGLVNLEAMNFVTPEKYASMGGAKLRPGDILYCLRGSVGKNAIFDHDGGGALASSLVALRSYSNMLVPRFAYWLLNSSQERNQRILFLSGSAQPNLSVENLAQMNFSVPPPSVQRSVADRIDLETSQFAEMIANAREAIALSKERRAALISAAVTGKIDVRGAA